MANSFSRSELILGYDAMQKLAAARVAVFGVGGVGGYVVEALARTGIGALDLIDNDTVCLTNLNRQIIATHDTIGKYKVDVFKERVHAINPDCKVATYKTFFLPETAGSFDFKRKRDGKYAKDELFRQPSDGYERSKRLHGVAERRNHKNGLRRG